MVCVCVRVCVFLHHFPPSLSHSFLTLLPPSLTSFLSFSCIHPSLFHSLTLMPHSPSLSLLTLLPPSLSLLSLTLLPPSLAPYLPHSHIPPSLSLTPSLSSLTLSLSSLSLSSLHPSLPLSSSLTPSHSSPPSHSPPSPSLPLTLLPPSHSLTLLPPSLQNGCVLRMLRMRARLCRLWWAPSLPFSCCRSSSSTWSSTPRGRSQSGDQDRHT